MKTMTRVAAATAALLTLAAADARAQLIELPTAGAAGDLTAHQIRVVQFALRDQQCYRGPINGRWTAATRTALQCARQRTNASDPDSLARQLALWSADAMTSRTMAGDVEPAAPAPAPTPAPSVTPAPTPSPAPMTPRPTPMRDSTMMPRPDSARMPRPDSAMMPRPDSAMMPRRDTSTTMPMTPTDPLSPMSRTGTTSATRDSLMAARRDTSMAADPAARAGGAMLSARLDSVIAEAESGLATMEPAQAATLLGSIATELDAAGDTTLAAIATDLRAVRTQLGATPLDSAQVGRSLTAASDRLETAAAGRTGDAQAKLSRLATVLERSARRYAPQE